MNHDLMLPLLGIAIFFFVARHCTKQRDYTGAVIAWGLCGALTWSTFPAQVTPIYQAVSETVAVAVSGVAPLVGAAVMLAVAVWGCKTILSLD